MNIPHKELYPHTLRSIVSEFVSRDGTDYGIDEVSLDRKIDQVLAQLDLGKATLTFDTETQTVNINKL